MSKKPKKGKTIALTDFLASEPKLVTVRDSTWAAIVDEDEAQKKPIVVDMSVLPTAPRSAVDIDYSTVPENPPFIAHVANLSFEIDDEELRRIFGDLNPKSARIIRENNRSRGAGLVEFSSRETLIEALKRSDKEVYGRKIRINVSDKPDFHQVDGHRNQFHNRFNRSGEDRPEMGDRWKRGERRSDEFSNNDRPHTGYNRGRDDQERSKFSGNSRDNQRSGDYGFGYRRNKDDRGYDRPGPRHRYNDDHNWQNDRMDRPKYSGRHDEMNEPRDQDASNDDNRQAPKERPRLQLQPRTKPLEDHHSISNSSSSTTNVGMNRSISHTEDTPSLNESSTTHPDDYQRQDSHNVSETGSSIDQAAVKSPVASRGVGASIFGGAKPVDTTARELEIERKLNELKMVENETGEEEHEKISSSRPSYNRGQERDNYRNKRPSYNDSHQDRDRRDDGRTNYHHKREHSGGRRYEDDGRRPNNGVGQHRHDRDRYNPPSRRDHDNGRSGKYNHHDNYGHRDRDSHDSNHQRRSSDDQFHTESQSKYQPRAILRRPAPTEDETNKLHLSNKFDMLNNDDEDPQSPSIDD
ncbi:unnamed protein product [Adineta ricciae]|uniref:RRM domain-containing protein n=1 Tax=Adineta ricciae TaxID=249248 RepID=A0A816CI56_ADIRI|nr:unnamed protein product [Adineta ricciae]CAF1625173.1 unnamed protein product [Adineta ricciae]